MIVIGTTRKPSQRIRSFVKELVRAIPNTIRLNRGKQSFAGFCEEALAHGASRILLVGGYHGNPGRITFLRHSLGIWGFQPPTIILKSVTLLRQSTRNPPPRAKRLYVVPDTEKDTLHAEVLAQALEAPLTRREELSTATVEATILLVALHQRSTLEFISTREHEPVGPSMLVRSVYKTSRGDRKRW